VASRKRSAIGNDNTHWRSGRSGSTSSPSSAAVSDAVGADPRLTALTSGFTGLQPFVARGAQAAGQPVAVHPVLMANSDHANFAAHGNPALRLVAGFDDAASNVRHILTAQDTRDKVAPQELAGAARVSAALLWQALCARDADVASWQ
jgi:hypothetical protein